MKKISDLYRDSFNELKSIGNITIGGMFMALSVILGLFTIEAGPYLKIGFGSIVNAFCYFIFGPVFGGVYGGVLDILKFIVKPTGAFFPGFTFNAILGGVIYGTVLYKRPMTFRRCLLAEFLVALFVNVILNTYFLSILYGKGFIALLPARVIKNAVKWPVDSAILWFLGSRLEKIGLVSMIRGLNKGRK